VWWSTLAAAAVVGLAGCGAGTNAPSVASVGVTTSRSAASTAKPPTRNPSQLLAEWGACMRSHGDPDQVDPSIDANKVIHIRWNPAIPGGYNGTNKGGHGNSGPGQYCRSYLDAAQSALQGGKGSAQPSPAKLLRFSECMRANGITDFPDPTASGLVINRGGDLNPSSPAFQRASTLCAKKTGAPGFGSAPKPGMIVLN
jgi:hypothetical protein